MRVKPGTKLRCIWYPTFAASVCAQYGIKPRHPQRGEIVTVESVLPTVQKRVMLVEYYDYEGFPLSRFAVAD